jgi:hypothetical protein
MMQAEGSDITWDVITNKEIQTLISSNYTEFKNLVLIKAYMKYLGGE